MQPHAPSINWSNSMVSWLRQCSRKFYFADQLATHGRKNMLRRKLFELKQMQTLSMWPGSVVDKVLEKYIVPAIANGEPLDFDRFADQAVELADRQFRFSQSKQYLDAGLTKGEAGVDFCILDTHEAGTAWPAQQLEAAYKIMRQAIKNLPQILMPDGATLLLDYLRSAHHLLPNVQTWRVQVEEANVHPQIDLLLYDAQWKPAAIDWKVSESWVSDYEKQLLIIGLVIYLKRLEKSDKPPYRHEDIGLFEVNLLKAEVKKHEFNEEHAGDLIDFIHLTSSDIQLMTEEIKEKELSLQDFDTTENQSTCNLCNFKPICSYLIQNKFNYNEDAYLKSLSANKY